MRVNFFMNPKKFSQFSPIDRAPELTSPLLRKTKIDHNLLLKNLVVTVCQVYPIYRHLQQVFQDLDIHTKSPPDLMKLKKKRPKASSRSKFIMGRDFAVTRSSPDSC